MKIFKFSKEDKGLSANPVIVAIAVIIFMYFAGEAIDELLYNLAH